MINDHKTIREWKIQLTMQTNFISSKVPKETLAMHTKSRNIEIIMGSETNDIIEELRKSLLQKHQEGLQESRRGSEFIRDSVNLLYYYLQKVGSNMGGSYIDSPEWMKK